MASKAVATMAVMVASERVTAEQGMFIRSLSRTVYVRVVNTITIDTIDDVTTRRVVNGSIPGCSVEFLTHFR